MSITLERTTSRIYFTGNTYHVKDRIKAIGGHWDADRRAWWVGTSKAPEAQSIADNATSTESPKVGDDSKVVAKATYKGRSYYVLWMGRCKSGAEKAHLAFLDGSIDFWADMALVTIIKHYRTEHTTIGGLRRFIEKIKRVEASGEAMPVSGCQACRNLGHMCERCRFDEFDN